MNTMSKGCRCTTKKVIINDDVQVEVSFNALDKLYSIAVTENKSLQSVVSVPTGASTAHIQQAGNKKKLLTLPFGTTPKKAGANSDRDAVGWKRLVDTLHPSSPTHSRISRRDTETSHCRHRRGPKESRSCPPPVNRGQEQFHIDEACLAMRNQRCVVRTREHSCPPTQRNGNVTSSFPSNTSNARQKEIHAMETRLSARCGKCNHTKSKTKDLVSVTRNKQRILFHNKSRPSNFKVVPV